MLKAVFVLTVAVALLVGCTLTPAEQNVLTWDCQLDQAAPAAVAAGSAVVSVAVPAAAPGVAIANALDPAVHQAIQDACAKLPKPAS